MATLHEPSSEPLVQWYPKSSTKGSQESNPQDLRNQILPFKFRCSFSLISTISKSVLTILTTAIAISKHWSDLANFEHD